MSREVRMVKVVALAGELGEEEELLGEAEGVLGEYRREVVELRELLEGIIAGIGQSLPGQARLRIEIGGGATITAGAEAGVKVLALNLLKGGAEYEGSESIKLILETDIGSNQVP